MALSVKASVIRALSVIGSSTTTNRISYALRRRQSQSHNNFSSVAEVSKDLVDVTLSKVLKCEIKYAKSNLKISQVETPTDSFPFIINDGERWRRISLEWEFPDGEYVIVTIDVEKIELSNEDDKEGDGSKKDIKPDIPMTVCIYKNNGRNQLNFDIIVSNENIVLKDLHTILDGDYTDVRWIKIREMDYELQRCLKKYLEVRGITSNSEFFAKKETHIPEGEGG